ncbi:uncharacterized protein [Temnothorax longispinosus]|uniref:uncharacterized protein n=1 Tax=Temnothorax longispinosus TaxID=300112 RepID=UPI003A991996
MTEINTLIDDLREQQRLMTNLLTNLRKMGKGKFTTSTLNTRLTNLNIMWTKCQDIHTEIRRLSTTEQKKSLPYFTKNEISEVETTYYEVSDYIVDVLNPRPSAMNANSTAIGHSLLHDGTQNSFMSLPKIPMPIFSGNYNDWISFRDLFTSLVINDERLHDVHRMYYLKSSVTGEASSLLKSAQVTDADFKLAWDQLKDRYENSRHIINAYLTKLFDVNTVTTKNVTELKRLRDQTHEAVGSLSNLGRPIDQWDDLLTFMAVRKLDPVSRREWEMRIGETTTYPTYNEIHKFLEYRVRALESIASSSSKKTSKSKDVDKSIKSHVSSVSKSCECEESHPLRLCEVFKAKSVEERFKYVQKQKLCYNCLYTGHPTNQCRSKYSCFHCKRRHHTLLHNPNAQGKGEKLAFSLGGGTVGKSAPVASSPLAAPNPSTSTPSTSQHVVAAVETLHAVKPKVAPMTVMLATAWVLVSSDKGRQAKVRALLDQGSQSSFVTKTIAQALRASRTKVRAPISGIGGTDAGTGRAIVTLTLNSCIGTNKPVQCSAIMFQKLTSYVPPRSLCQESWRHLEGLEMADSDPSSDQPIQLILGADVYANILREGLTRGHIGSPIAQKTTFGWILSAPTTSGDSSQVTTLTAHLACDHTTLLNELCRFWKLEKVSTSHPLNEEEVACEAHFAATHNRVPGGRYCVKLPFKNPTPINIGSSSQIAKDWLAKLQRKFIIYHLIDVDLAKNIGNIHFVQF